MSELDKFKVLDAKDGTTKEYWDHLAVALVESSKSLIGSDSPGENQSTNKDLSKPRTVQTSSLSALQSKTGAQCLRIKTDTSPPAGEFLGTEETQENVLRFKKKPTQ